MSEKPFYYSIEATHTPPPTTFVPHTPPDTSMRTMTGPNPMASLSSRDSIFRGKGPYELRMPFQPPTATMSNPFYSPAATFLPPQPPEMHPRYFHEATMRGNHFYQYCFTKSYCNHISQTEQTMLTHYQTSGYSMGPDGMNVSRSGMPIQIQPYTHEPRLPIQTQYKSPPYHDRPRSGMQIPSSPIDLAATLICNQEPYSDREQSLRKPQTAPHSMEYTPACLEHYSTSSNRPPEYNPAIHTASPAIHTEPYSLQFGCERCRDIPDCNYDHYSSNCPNYATRTHLESMCGGAEMSTGDPVTLRDYGSEPETLQIAEEKCPKCGTFFTMKELKQHADWCRHTHVYKLAETTSVDVVDSSFLETTFPECFNCGQNIVGGLEEHYAVCSISGDPCPHCKEFFPAVLLPEHVDSCDKNPKARPVFSAVCGNRGNTCTVCLEVVAPSKMEAHKKMCLKSQIGEYTDLNTRIMKRCLSCLRDIEPCEFYSHIKKCDDMLLGDIARFKTFAPCVKDIDWASVNMTKEQRNAIEYVVKKAKTLSDQVDRSLFERVGKLGFNREDLETTLEWIKMDSPIIIHVFLDQLLPLLMNETHYKNQFETGTSHGSRDLESRKSWENNIFNNIYKNANGKDRVKYGVLNIVGDIRGVKSCKQYGDSFLTLRKVRLRTSFASADSSHATVKIASCEHYKHVLNEYQNNELTAVIQVATKKKPYANSDVIHHYKEVQIHGPIVLAEHIECVMYHERHQSDKHLMDMLELFRMKNNCNSMSMEMP